MFRPNYILADAVKSFQHLFVLMFKKIYSIRSLHAERNR
jgi:hypothetical protein